MEALLTTFIAAGLAEFGDKTQLLAIALGARYRRPFPVLLGVAVGALANTLIAAAGGTFVSGMITLRAISLLVAVAILFAGVAAFIPQKTESDMGTGWKTNALITTAVCFFLLEFGDKTQFFTFALGAQYSSVALAAAGATAGVVLANVPGVILGERAAAVLPLRRMRVGIGILFLIVGTVIAVNALRLA